MESKSELTTSPFDMSQFLLKQHTRLVEKVPEEEKELCLICATEYEDGEEVKIFECCGQKMKASCWYQHCNIANDSALERIEAEGGNPFIPNCPFCRKPQQVESKEEVAEVAEDVDNDSATHQPNMVFDRNGAADALCHLFITAISEVLTANANVDDELIMDIYQRARPHFVTQNNDFFSVDALLLPLFLQKVDEAFAGFLAEHFPSIAERFQQDASISEHFPSIAELPEVEEKEEVEQVESKEEVAEVAEEVAEVEEVVEEEDFFEEEREWRVTMTREIIVYVDAVNEAAAEEAVMNGEQNETEYLDEIVRSIELNE